MKQPSSVGTQALLCQLRALIDYTVEHDRELHLTAIRDALRAGLTKVEALCQTRRTIAGGAA